MRFWRPGRRVARRLVLHLGIELRAEQNDHDRDPDPGHEADDRAERAIGLIVAAESAPRTKKTGPRRSIQAIAAKALPQVIQRQRALIAARAVPVEDRDRQGQDNHKYRPASRF